MTFLSPLIRLATRSRLIFLGAMLVAIVATSAFADATGGKHSVTGQFSNANGLVAGNELRVHGIEVGSVDSVTLNTGQGGQYAVVQMTVPDTYWPLHNGSHFSIRPKGVLSNVYMELEPGASTGATLSADHVFAVAETSSPVNLDDLTNIFSAPVRSSIQTQLQEAVVMFGNGGADALNGTLANANPLLAAAIPITGTLAQRSPELDKLTIEFDTISANLAREDANLRGLISNADVTLTAIASREVALQSTLVHAASVLTELDAALTGESSNLQAIFNRGPQALNLLKANADALTPLITHVNPYIGDLNQLMLEFVTANGYTTGTPGGIDTLRADVVFPTPDKTASECGGQPSEQASACPGQHPVGP